MEQKTAVGWLQEVIVNHISHEQQMQLEGLFQQAKQMEMMQIVKSYHRGLFGSMELEKPIVFADEYYKDTYNK
jgi:hypothetical protein